MNIAENIIQKTGIDKAYTVLTYSVAVITASVFILLMLLLIVSGVIPTLAGILLSSIGGRLNSWGRGLLKYSTNSITTITSENWLRNLLKKSKDITSQNSAECEVFGPMGFEEELRLSDTSEDADQAARRVC